MPSADCPFCKSRTAHREGCQATIEHAALMARARTSDFATIPRSKMHRDTREVFDNLVDSAQRIAREANGNFYEGPAWVFDTSARTHITQAGTETRALPGSRGEDTVSMVVTLDNGQSVRLTLTAEVST